MYKIELHIFELEALFDCVNQVKIEFVITNDAFPFEIAFALETLHKLSNRLFKVLFKAKMNRRNRVNLQFKELEIKTFKAFKMNMISQLNIQQTLSSNECRNKLIKLLQEAN